MHLLMFELLRAALWEKHIGEIMNSHEIKLARDKFVACSQVSAMLKDVLALKWWESNRVKNILVDT